jgi:hypothetical protein
MGTVFKKQVTRPFPQGAEVFTRKGERFARWTDRRGKTRTAPLTTGKNGADRIVTESPYFVAKYRDGAGVVRVVPTGCRDETAARRVLADLERRAELIRSGVVKPAEAAIGEHQATALGAHVTDYLTHLEAAEVSAKHLYEVERRLRRVVADCDFARLADLEPAPVERWLVARAKEDMSARTRNTYLVALLAFCNWCVEGSRLAANPSPASPGRTKKRTAGGPGAPSTVPSWSGCSKLPGADRCSTR